MSASLVGSEMCIRDSPSTSVVTRACLELPQGSGHAWSSPPNGRGHHGPVSYTHLTLPTICSV
eukprot:12661591-Alexandrium_andersonii.AAC.1